MYVTTKEESSHGEGIHSIPVLEPNRLSLLRGNMDLADRLIKQEFASKVQFDDVTLIQVELTSDFDEDMDDDDDVNEPVKLVTIFSR
jgi:hypothetical protein